MKFRLVKNIRTSANATLIAVLDRLFYASRFDKTMKVGASVVSCRRGGASATFDELNKYFQSVVCLLYRVNIGIQFMEIMHKKPIRMKRVNKQCVL